MIQVLEYFAIPPKLINLLKMTVDQTTAKVKLEQQIGDEFHYSKGFKQGDGLSTTLCILTLHMTIQKVDKRGTIIYKSSQICAYADDVAIITRTEAELKKIYKQLEKETKKLGLYVTIIKTKYMFITSKDNKKKEVNTRIGTKELEGVSTFKYLGLLIRIIRIV
jgi:sorting nexin-29